MTPCTSLWLDWCDVKTCYLLADGRLHRTLTSATSATSGIYLKVWTSQTDDGVPGRAKCAWFLSKLQMSPYDLLGGYWCFILAQDSAVMSKV